VSAVYGFVYFGFLVSVLLRALLVDSFGRRPLMILFNGMMAAGAIIAVTSINIWVTGFGLFLLNCGSDGAMKFTFNFLTEYYHP
jgi:MFS family permease